MSRVGIRQLRADAASIVRRAGGGERIVVTVNGRPLAELGPAGGAQHATVTLDDLVARRLVEPPRRHDSRRLGEPVATWPGARLDRMLRELRG